MCRRWRTRVWSDGVDEPSRIRYIRCTRYTRSIARLPLSFPQEGGELRLTGTCQGGTLDVKAEVAVSLVGFRPDLELTRELQAFNGG